MNLNSYQTRSAGRLLTVVLAVVAVLALAGPAAAHLGGERAGSDFDGRVTSVTPQPAGVTVRVLRWPAV